MANIVQINLLENKTAQALWNGRPIEYEGGYRIIAGENAATQFELTNVPKQYENVTFTITGYNAGKQVVTFDPVSKGGTFTLPVGMAIAGYSSLVFECVNGEEKRVLWTPIKLKVYNTNPDWVKQSISPTQAMLDRLSEAESAIRAEVTRAQEAEATLNQNIIDEATRATTKETELTNIIKAINDKIPAQATANNQLADKDFVNSSINNLAAYYITKNAARDPFATKAELDNALEYYSGGVVRQPTTNDYCIVIADESHKDAVTGVSPTTRYRYNNGGWEFQYVVNNSPFTAAQWAALNSNITAEKITAIDTAISQAQTTANNAMPKSGGQFTGQVSWNSASLPDTLTSDFFLVIEPFAQGGKTYYVPSSTVKTNLGIDAAASEAATALSTAQSKYTKPSGGIPKNDLSTEVQNVLNNSVLFTSQSLTATQKAQARSNIGAGTSNFDGDYYSLSNTPYLFSGYYEDLYEKPTIPDAVRLRSNTNSYLTGDISLNAGSNITLSQSGNTITIASTASGGGGGSDLDNKIYIGTDNIKIALNADKVYSQVNGYSIAILNTDNTPSLVGSESVAIGYEIDQIGDNSIAIGYRADTGSLGDCIVIGHNAYVENGSGSVAIGAEATTTMGISIGPGSNSYMGVAIGFMSATMEHGYALGSQVIADAYTVVLGDDQTQALICNAGSVTTLSDERTKENIELANLEMCYNDVLRLPVHRFQFKKEFNPNVLDKHQTGFLAQEVEKVFPKAVHITSRQKLELDENDKPIYEEATDEKGSTYKKPKGEVIKGIKYLDKDFAIPTLWAAFQYMAQKVEALAAKLAGLEELK